MNYLRKLIKAGCLVVIVVLAALGMCGCRPSSAKVEREALKYLEEKYGEKFEITYVNMGGFDVDYDEVTCHSESHKDERVNVYCRTNGGKLVFLDNYYGILKNDEYRAIIREVVEKYIPDILIYSNLDANAFEPEFDKDYELSAAIEKNYFQFFSWTKVVVREGTNVSQEDFDSICNTFKDMGLALNFEICVVPNDMYEDIKETDDFTQFRKTTYSSNSVFESMIKQ